MDAASPHPGSVPDSNRPLIGARTLLWGHGLNALPPGRRLVWDTTGLVVTLALLVALAVVFDFDRGFAVTYIVGWAVFHIAFATYRYVKATRRSALLTNSE